jgi:hypothetical protein
MSESSHHELECLTLPQPSSYSIDAVAVYGLFQEMVQEMVGKSVSYDSVQSLTLLWPGSATD